VILGTAGHIDHGKTSLVRCLTGVDTDRLPEEKRRGITIELGFAPLELEGVGTVGVVDVPGHEAFVRTMVAGATGIDLALLVVAADEGIMPQTREHLTILQLLGVQRGAIAITKADLVEPDWLALVEDDVREATRCVLPDAPVVVTSAATGAGIAELRHALGAVARSTARPDQTDVFRMPIDRVFSIRGTGTVVTGTVWSGKLTRDESVRILPGARSARVRTIQSHGSQLETAGAGTRAAIALAGVDVPDVARGSVLVTEQSWRPTNLIRADVVFTSAEGTAIRPRTWLRFHVGTSEVGARVVMRAGAIKPNEPLAARVILDESIVLRAGDRFVLRTTAPLNTIGGGVVVDPYAVRRAKPWPVRLELADRLRLIVTEAGYAGVPTRDLLVRLGATAASCDRLVSAASDSVLVHSGRVTSLSALYDLEQRLIELASAHHVSNPLELGASLQWVRSRLHAPDDLIDLAVSRQVKAGTLQIVGGALAQAGWTPKPTADQAALGEKLLTLLSAAGSEPPSSVELSAQLKTDVEPVLRFLERQGVVAQVEPGRYYEATQLKQLLERLRTGMPTGIERSPSELRDVLGISRKFLIPFLEYCDAAGYTIRSGSGRVWRGK
jgi:selenocysteine-specific elongation factor